MINDGQESNSYAKWQFEEIGRIRIQGCIVSCKGESTNRFN
jgi:hypothetical protein